jgi:hypothetical protein
MEAATAPVACLGGRPLSDVDAAGGGERARVWTRRRDVGLASSRLPPAHGTSGPGQTHRQGAFQHPTAVIPASFPSVQGFSFFFFLFLVSSSSVQISF